MDDNQTRYRKRRRHRRLTGEDIDMLNENSYERKNRNKTTICDTHIDGA